MATNRKPDHPSHFMKQAHLARLLSLALLVGGLDTLVQPSQSELRAIKEASRLLGGIPAQFLFARGSWDHAQWQNEVEVPHGILKEVYQVALLALGMFFVYERVPSDEDFKALEVGGALLCYPCDYLDRLKGRFKNISDE